MTDPQQLVAALEERGWTPANQGSGYVRLYWPGLTNRTALFVPTSPDSPDFTDLWQSTLAELEDAVATGVQAAYVLAGLHTPPERKGQTVPGQR